MSSTLVLVEGIIVLFVVLGASYKLLKVPRYEEKVKNSLLLKRYISILEWSARIIPPLLLFYLIYKPSIAGGHWSQVFCILVVIISIMTLITRLVNNRKKEFNIALYVRSVMAIIAGVIVILVLGDNDKKAREYLWQVAGEIQNQCAMNLECPEFPAGWTNKSRPTYGYSPTTPEYANVMYYQSAGKRETFDIFIHYGPDMDFWVRGGVDKEPIEYFPELD